MGESIEVDSSQFYPLGKALAQAGARLRLRVRGGSMYPSIRDGDVVEIAPVPMHEIGVGDVIFYRAGRRLFVHRVIEYCPEGPGLHLVTRGDALCVPDRPVQEEADMIGRVEAVYRGQRAIRLDRGLVRYGGGLIARSRVVHLCVRWAGRVWRRARRTFPLPGQDRGMAFELESEEQHLEEVH